MHILKYICFNSSEEFAKWQIDNPDYTIHNIIPLVSGMDLKVDHTTPETAEANAITNVSAFVTYFVAIN